MNEGVRDLAIEESSTFENCFAGLSFKSSSNFTVYEDDGDMCSHAVCDETEDMPVLATASKAESVTEDHEYVCCHCDFNVDFDYNDDDHQHRHHHQDHLEKGIGRTNVPVSDSSHHYRSGAGSCLIDQAK